MSFERRSGPAALLVFLLPLVTLLACGGGSGNGTSADSAPGAKSSGRFRAGTLYLVVDFERRKFDLLQGTVPLWTLPFVAADTAKVSEWVQAFVADPPLSATPLEENILLSSRSQLSDSVMAIVAEASGFDAALLQRYIPARFILRWDEAALEVKSSAHGSGAGLRQVWEDARLTARRLFGEAQLTVQVDSIGALTLQRAARPPILTIVRPPRKR